MESRSHLAEVCGNSGARPAVRPATTLPFVSLVAGLMSVTAAPADPSPRPDTFVSRLEALASMETLNADLLASRSATLTLEIWCGGHALADPPRLVAIRVPGAAVPPSPEQRARLGVGPDEPIEFRRVRLACGGHVLSEADNWFVPARLTPAMNEALRSTDTPFGKVVAPLHPVRQTVNATVLWQALPPGWEMRPPPPDGIGALAIPPVLFEHRAILYDADRRPFSEVDERYTRETLAFDRMARPGEGR